MLLDLFLAIAHHLLIFILFGILVAELVLAAPGISARALERLTAVDLWYGIVAGVILITGSIRAVYAAKG